MVCREGSIFKQIKYSYIFGNRVLVIALVVLPSIVVISMCTVIHCFVLVVVQYSKTPNMTKSKNVELRNPSITREKISGLQVNFGFYCCNKGRKL